MAPGSSRKYLSLAYLIYGVYQVFVGVSSKGAVVVAEDIFQFWISPMIFRASTLLMGLSGLNDPSGYPCTHPSCFAFFK